jgi:hypothetical protein
MKKIPSLFIRDWDGNPSLVTRVVDPSCAWVIEGEGTPTRKWDGSCVMVRGGVLYARYDCKVGKFPPPGFEACGEADEKTGHCPGWVPANRLEDVWLREAFFSGAFADGTYEACGPKIGGNAEGFAHHILLRHGGAAFHNVPLDFDGLKVWFTSRAVEGIVWHHPDGKMVKIKRADFGLAWGSKKERARR